MRPCQVKVPDAVPELQGVLASLGSLNKETTVEQAGLELCLCCGRKVLSISSVAPVAAGFVCAVLPEGHELAAVADFVLETFESELEAQLATTVHGKTRGAGFLSLPLALLPPDALKYL